MIKLEIYEEVATSSDMVDVLNEIATKVKEGYVEGYNPNWRIVGVEEPTIK